jgi:hypothetical protein
MPVPSQVEGTDKRATDASPILVPVIVLLLSMGACATIPPEAPPMPITQCNIEAVRWAIGREPTSDVVEQARVQSGSATVRVIHPGDAVTRDFRSDRLNLSVNARNAIDGLRCE